MQRRQFLKYSAFTAAACHFPLWASNSTYDVVIIGSGLAGLNAAKQCQAAGISYAVLEASARVGGRIKSLDSVAGTPELGGMQIGKGYGLTRYLINEYELPLTPPLQFARGQAMSIEGQLFDSKNWPTQATNLLPTQLKKLPPAALLNYYLKKAPAFDANQWLEVKQQHLDISLEHYLTSLGASDYEIGLMENSFNGISLKQHSALDALKGVNARKGLGRGFDLIKGGNEQLPLAMAKSLKHNVHLSHQVSKISGTNGSYQLACKNGAQFSAKKLILALPFASLKHIELAIELSTAKKHAINHLSYTPVTQAVFNVNAPFWEADNKPAGLWSDTLIERIFPLKNAKGDIATLLCWINGTNAQKLDKLNKSEQQQLLLSELTKVRPSTKGKVELVHIESWAGNPLQGGAYAHYLAGTVGSVAPHVAKSEHGVYFAGEHTQPLLPGIEAALVSGMHVVDEVKQAL